MTEPLTAAEIDADLALCEKATEGPWGVFRVTYEHQCGHLVLGSPDRKNMKDDFTPTHDDAAFIAAARTGWPRALAGLKEARMEIEEARDDAETMRSGWRTAQTAHEDTRNSLAREKARADRAEAALAAMTSERDELDAEIGRAAEQVEEIARDARGVAQTAMERIIAAEDALAIRTAERDDAREGWQDATNSANAEHANAKDAKQLPFENGKAVCVMRTERDRARAVLRKVLIQWRNGRACGCQACVDLIAKAEKEVGR